MTTETENQHLKELLKRLQDENVSLKNTSFTFSVPRNGDVSSFPSPQNPIFASTSHIPSTPSSEATKAGTPHTSSLDTPSAFPDIDFGSLTPLDSASIDLLDDPDAIMSYDFGYGQFVPSRTPYKTIASNPMFMSFADPSPETGQVSKSTSQPDSNVSSPFDLNFGQWSGQTTTREGSSHTGHLDELFGGHIFDSQSPINFNVLMKSAATSPVSPALAPSMSPVVHQSAHTPPAASSSNPSSPFESPDPSSTTGLRHNADTCPKTRAQMEQRIQAEGSSMFAPPPPQEEARSPVFRAPAGADGPPMIMCKGATFPPTEKSDHNIDVLTAWERIRSHPHFSVSDPVLRVGFS